MRLLLGLDLGMGSAKVVAYELGSFALVARWPDPGYWSIGATTRARRRARQ